MKKFSNKGFFTTNSGQFLNEITGLNGTAVGLGLGGRIDFTLGHEEDHVALSAVQESCLGPQDWYPVFGLPWPI